MKDLDEKKKQLDTEISEHLMRAQRFNESEQKHLHELEKIKANILAKACLAAINVDCNQLKKAQAKNDDLEASRKLIQVLDIDRRLTVLVSFTVKLVSEIMRASWGSLCDFPKVHPINVIASGGMLLTAFSYVTAIIDGMAQRGNPYPHGKVA